nr:O-antigen ligase family protein [uncultured Devosia sp.]
MSDIEITTSRSGRSGRRVPPSPASSRQTATNRRMGWALIILLGLVPLPFGSVHGFSWGFFATYTGVAAVLYIWSLHRLGETFRHPLRGLGLSVALYVAFIIFLGIQILPFGSIFGPIAYAEVGGVPLVSNTVSITPDMTLLMLMRQITYGVFFVLVLQAAVNDGRRQWLLDGVLIVISAYAVLGVISLNSGDTVLGIAKTAYEGSATGPFVNRNSFATFLGFGAIIALSQVGRRIIDQVERHPNDGRVAGNTSAIVLYGVVFLLLIAMIVATQSRMGLLATFAGSLVVVLVVLTRTGVSLALTVGIIALGILAAALGLVLFGASMFDRILDLDRSSTIRTDLYVQVWELILRRPMLGFGGGSFELAFPLVHREPVTSGVTWDKAHNSYLALWSELGLVAGSIPTLMAVVTALRLIGSLRRASRNWAAQTVALAALVLGGLHSLVDFSLEIQANSFMLLAIVAAGTAAAYEPKR